MSLSEYPLTGQGFHYYALLSVQSMRAFGLQVASSQYAGTDSASATPRSRLARIARGSPMCLHRTHAAARHACAVDGHIHHANPVLQALACTA